VIGLAGENPRLWAQSPTAKYRDPRRNAGGSANEQDIRCGLSHLVTPRRLRLEKGYSGWSMVAIGILVWAASSISIEQSGILSAPVDDPVTPRGGLSGLAGMTQCHDELL
jgi:hypothetical protein